MTKVTIFGKLFSNLFPTFSNLFTTCFLPSGDHPGSIRGSSGGHPEIIRGHFFDFFLNCFRVFFEFFLTIRGLPGPLPRVGRSGRSGSGGRGGGREGGRGPDRGQGPDVKKTLPWVPPPGTPADI